MSDALSYQIIDVKNGSVLAQGEKALKEKQQGKNKAESRLGAQVCIPKKTQVRLQCTVA